MKISQELQDFKARIFEAMKSDALTRIVVSYSGSGDSGQIDGCEVEPYDRILQNEIAFNHPNWQGQLSGTIDDAAEQFAENLLEELSIDYCNDDGGAGMVILQIAQDGAQTCTIEHSAYYQASEESTYEIDDAGATVDAAHASL